MTDPDGPDQPEPIDADELSAPTRGGRQWRSRLVRVALAALLVASTAMAVAQMDRADSARDELERYADARRTASAFGAAYLTYDASDVKASSQRVLALTTDAFGEQFEQTRSPGIEELFDQIGTSTTASVTEVFLTEVSRERATALVVVDVHASSKETPDQTLVDLTFVLDLVLEDEGWKVDAVAPAPRPDVVGDAQPSSTTTAPTATTVPSPPTSE
jgi:hypothetical protein